MRQYSNYRDSQEKLTGQSLKQNSTLRHRPRARHKNGNTSIGKSPATFDLQCGHSLFEDRAQITGDFTGSPRTLTRQDRISSSFDGEVRSLSNSSVSILFTTPEKQSFAVVFSNFTPRVTKQPYALKQKIIPSHRTISAHFLHWREMCFLLHANQLNNINVDYT